MIFERAVSGGGLAATVAVALYFGPNALLRLLAGMTAILAPDKRPRAKRALDVLKALRHRDRDLVRYVKRDELHARVLAHPFKRQ